MMPDSRDITTGDELTYTAVLPDGPTINRYHVEDVTRTQGEVIIWGYVTDKFGERTHSNVRLTLHSQPAGEEYAGVVLHTHLEEGPDGRLDDPPQPSLAEPDVREMPVVAIGATSGDARDELQEWLLAQGVGPAAAIDYLATEPLVGGWRTMSEWADHRGVTHQAVSSNVDAAETAMADALPEDPGIEDPAVTDLTID